MGRKLLYNFLSVSFFVILVVASVMLTDVIFNSSSNFFDRFSDLKIIYEGIKV